MVTKTSIPEISVVMPVYNAKAYVAEAVQSVLRQTYRNLELVVIDDGSTDDSLGIVQQFDDRRIAIAKNSQNIGLVATLTKGLALSRGNFIARMDADDISEPERLAKQLHFLRGHPKVDIVGGAIHFFGSIRRPYTHVFPTDHEDIRVAMLFYCPLAHPALMFRRSLVDRNLLSYSDDFRHAEDYHLWSQLLQSVRAANIRDLVLHYRLHTTQVSSEHVSPQYRVSKKVRELLLDRAGVDQTQADVDLHESIVREHFGSDAAYINRVALWFEKIELANQASRFWDRGALHRLFASRCEDIAIRVALGHPTTTLTQLARQYLRDAGYQPERLMNRLQRRAMRVARQVLAR